jgi:FkbM family methyltransferase
MVKRTNMDDYFEKMRIEIYREHGKRKELSHEEKFVFRNLSAGGLRKFVNKASGALPLALALVLKKIIFDLDIKLAFLLSKCVICFIMRKTRKETYITYLHMLEHYLSGVPIEKFRISLNGKEIIFNLVSTSLNKRGQRREICNSSFYHVFLCMMQGQYTDNYDFRNKTILDAGANIGVFSLFSVLLGAKRVYSFEPVKATSEILKKNIESSGMERYIIPINKGLGKENSQAKIAYKCEGDPEASICNKHGRKNIENINVIKLDDFLEREIVDFMKIDVEGFESNVLLGAAKSIKKHKPAIVMASYHRPEDKKNLPKLLKSIQPGYRCDIRFLGEEDFYCSYVGP